VLKLGALNTCYEQIFQRAVFKLTLALVYGTAKIVQYVLVEKIIKNSKYLA